MEDDGMEIQLLLSGHANEANLNEILGGTFDHNTHMMIYEHEVLNGDGAKAAHEVLTDHDMQDYVEPSMLGCFLAPWRSGRRGTRMRSRSWGGVNVNQFFGTTQYPCTSVGEKSRSRKNNDHWTEGEVIGLVDGVSKVGFGKWSKVKELYFSTSIRTAEHLKDKWRNLVRACKTKSTCRNRKVNVQMATELIVGRFRHQILTIEAKRLGEKSKPARNMLNNDLQNSPNSAVLRMAAIRCN